MLKCGIYESDITCALGSEMPGAFATRLGQGIKEPLCCEAVYFENEGEKAVLISLDVISVYQRHCDAAREQIAEKLDMKPGNILICCTHDHTSAPVETWGDFVHINEDYMKFLISRCVDSAVMAASSAREVNVAFASCEEDKLGYCRNFVTPDGIYHTWDSTNGKPLSEPDHEVGVLRIDNADGTPYGVIVNYACHSCCVGGLEYSAEYGGIMRENLRKFYGKDFMPVFINGFSGDINHCDPKGFHTEIANHYKRMGIMLAADVIRTRELAVNKFENTTIDSRYEVIELPTREPSEELIKWAEETMAKEGVGVMDDFYAREALRIADEGVKQIPLPLMTLRIGELVLYTMPGEIFTTFAKMIKARSPFKYNMTSNIANGSIGYVPTTEAFHDGIYEARLCCSSKLVKDAGYTMTDKLLEMAATL